MKKKKKKLWSVEIFFNIYTESPSFIRFILFYFISAAHFYFHAFLNLFQYFFTCFSFFNFFLWELISFTKSTCWIWCFHFWSIELIFSLQYIFSCSTKTKTKTKKHSLLIYLSFWCEQESPWCIVVEKEVVHVFQSIHYVPMAVTKWLDERCHR